MPTKKKKRDISSSSSNNYSDALLSSLSQSSSSGSSSRSSSNSSSRSSSSKGEKLSSSSLSKIDGVELYNITDREFTYYNKNKKEVTLDQDSQVFYYGNDGKFYNRNKKPLNYEIYDIIKTKDNPMKMIISIEPDLSPSYSSVSSGYQLVDNERLIRFVDDAKITYYDENNIKFKPSTFETVVYFSINDDYTPVRYRYYNLNKRLLDYDTMEFDLNGEIKIKIKSSSSKSQGSSSSSSKSTDVIKLPSQLSNLKPANFSIIYLDRTMINSYIPDEDDTIYYYTDDNKYYNKKGDLLKYKLRLNNQGVYVAFIPLDQQDISSKKSSSLIKWTDDIEYLNDKYQPYIPSKDEIIEYFDKKYNVYNYKKEKLNYRISPVRNQPNKFTAILFQQVATVSKSPSPIKSPTKSSSKSTSPLLLQPIKSPTKSLSLKPWTYTTDYKDRNNQSFFPSSDDIIDYYDRNFNYYNKKGILLNYKLYRDDTSGIYIARLPKLSFSSRTASRASSHTASRAASHTPSRAASRTASRKKRSRSDDKTFTASTSSSPVSVNEEKIKLCSRWAFNKRENPERPKNPTTNRNIVKNGKIYNDLNKKCRKIPVLSNAMRSSSSSAADVDSQTIKTCAKWAIIKQKNPDKPYNPDNKRKTPIKIGGPTYKKLDKMCKKVKINGYRLSSSSKSSLIQDADSETIKRCNKWAAIKMKYPDEPYNPDNKKKTKIKVDGPTYKRLNKECHKIPIDPKYKMAETPINSKDKIDSVKLMKQCKAFEKLQEKYKKNPDDKKLRKKLKEYKDKIKVLKEKCPLLKKRDTKKGTKKDIEKIILNEDDRYLCIQWAKIKKDYPDNLYNPITKAQINKDGPTYNKLEKKCKDFKIKTSDIDSIKIANPKKNLEKKILNKELCLEWRDKRDVNPLTNKFIQKDGKTYKDIKKQCKEIMQKKER